MRRNAGQSFSPARWLRISATPRQKRWTGMWANRPSPLNEYARRPHPRAPPRPDHRRGQPRHTDAPRRPLRASVQYVLPASVAGLRSGPRLSTGADDATDLLVRTEIISESGPHYVVDSLYRCDGKPNHPIG